MKEERCYITLTNKINSAGEFEKELVCFCGTTACKQNWYYTPDKKECIDEPLTKEEEKKFYKGVLNRT